MKRAAIYVRVSSERQAEGVSPEAQEADCRTLCEQKGYAIVAVYRDIEKYRVGKRMVEPSGSRADRPGLKAMLAAAREEKFDLIIAWREDRLYRSYRPLLDVLDTLDATRVDIELVKETFDKRIAPVKAWAARMELDAKHDRLMMGMAGRLGQGKIWNGPAPYGYEKTADGAYIVNDAEAQWVRKIFHWYGEGVAVTEVRRRLVAAGAKQRKEGNKRVWHMTTIRSFLRAAHYWSGVHMTKWNGKVYEIPIPPLVTKEAAERVAARHRQYQTYPAGNAKNDALAAGIIRCASCGTVLCFRRMSNGQPRKDGTLKYWEYYTCVNYSHRTHGPECAQVSRADDIDSKIWTKVSSLFCDPGVFETALQQRITEVQAEESVAGTDVSQLERELDELALERQKVIGWARKDFITEQDMATQLMGLDVQAKSLQRELADKRLLVGNRAERLIELAVIYREQVQAGLAAMQDAPATEEEVKFQKKYQRQIVQNLVKCAWVHGDKSVSLDLELDLPETVNISSVTAFC